MKTIRPLPLLVPAALLFAACASAPAPDGAFVSDPDSGAAPGATWSGELRSWGTLREALRDGRVEARVAVADAVGPDTHALGALADLRGEVTVADGVAWISEGDAAGCRTTRGAPGDARATVLFATDVPAWTDLAVEEAVDPSELDAYVKRRADELGLDTSRPFPFRVEGGLVEVKLHVIAGACPMRARMLGEAPEPPPFELALDAVDGRLVGFHAEDSAGELCHASSRVHAHVLLERDGQPLTGHVEWAGLAPGAVLRLPRP